MWRQIQRRIREFFLEQGEVPDDRKKEIGRVVLARKLLEVRALLGFTRIDAAGAGTEDGASATIAPVYRNRCDWLPAVQVRGEGIFIKLNETAVSLWETKPAVQDRAQAMGREVQAMGRRSKIWTIALSRCPLCAATFVSTRNYPPVCLLTVDTRQVLSGNVFTAVLIPRNQWQVYFYTLPAQTQKGGLGGLVDLGNPKRFPDLLEERTSVRHAMLFRPFMC